MSRITKLMSAIAALAGGASLSAALPVVTVLAPAPSNAYLHTITGDDVFIYSNSSVQIPDVVEIRVSTAQPGQALGTITVKVADAGKRVQLFVDRSGGPVLRVHSILRDSSPQSLGEVWLENLFTHEDVGQGDRQANPPTRSGQIRVNRIGNIVSRRNIFADITVVTEAQSVGRNGIDFIQTVFDSLQGGNPVYHQDGSLYANIDAGTRGIGELDIANTITSLTAVPLVVASQGDVGTVSAGSMGLVTFDMSLAEINTFRTTKGGWGGDETCGLLPIQPNPQCTGPASLGGVLTAKRVRSMALKKNLESTVTVSQTDANDVWRIGRSLKPAARINLPANGLKHQIIVNQQNVEGVWDNNAPV